MCSKRGGRESEGVRTQAKLSDKGKNWEGKKKTEDVGNLVW